jgi:hypothetical protein
MTLKNFEVIHDNFEMVVQASLVVVVSLTSLREKPNMISAGTPFNLIENIRGSPQSFLANAGIISEDRPQPLPSTSFQIYFSLFSKYPTSCIFSFTDRAIK